MSGSKRSAISRRPPATRFSPKSRDPGRDQRLDLLDAALLGDRDQRHVARVAPRSLGGARDLVANVGKSGCGVGHARAL